MSSAFMEPLQTKHSIKACVNGTLPQRPSKHVKMVLGRTTCFGERSARIEIEPGPATACHFCGTRGSTSIEITPTMGTRLIETTEELYTAVDAYLEQGYLTQGYGIHNMSAWNVSLITNFSRVFDYQRNRSSPMIDFVDPGINNWDVSRATTFARMFRGGIQAFDQTLHKWKTSNVVDFSSMFEFSVLSQDLSSGIPVRQQV